MLVPTLIVASLLFRDDVTKRGGGGVPGGIPNTIFSPPLALVVNATTAVQALLFMAGSILQKLISKYPNVSREVLNEHCSSDLANKVARKIDRWRELALYLSLEDAEMSEIECDNKKEMERRLETLRMWKRKCGSSATHRVLVEAFLKCQRVDLAETVFNLLEQRSTSVS